MAAPQVTLGYTAFPHLFDDIFNLTDHEGLLVLRRTSHELCERVDAKLFNRVVVKRVLEKEYSRELDPHFFELYDGARNRLPVPSLEVRSGGGIEKPKWGRRIKTTRLREMFKHARVVDCPITFPCIILPLRKLEYARVNRVHSSVKYEYSLPPADGVVLSCSHIPYRAPILHPPGRESANGTSKLVISLCQPWKSLSTLYESFDWHWEDITSIIVIMSPRMATQGPFQRRWFVWPEVARHFRAFFKSWKPTGHRSRIATLVGLEDALQETFNQLGHLDFNRAEDAQAPTLPLRLLLDPHSWPRRTQGLVDALRLLSKTIEQSNIKCVSLKDYKTGLTPQEAGNELDPLF
ncbi:uncharacterized protein LOC62_03G003834 [Vanrija pseudolonga]|uniref:Uncharacterized protein n=1 Tax=Vanrija pseudolonga TaxID=143232 RepID=A0AAF0YB05_9TREE|nr:hypothetical protein LOC62_03G003834 [Vanrija pseudolonga]